MFEINQPNEKQDLETLLNRMKCIDDVLSYNITFNLHSKYTVWTHRHRDLIDELEFMIKEDLERICENGQ